MGASGNDRANHMCDSCLMSADTHRQVKRAAAVGAVVVGVAVAGCGGSAKSTTATSTGTTSGSTTAGAPPMRATGPPVVVASGIYYASNLAFDAHGGLWVVSADVGPGTPGELWYVPPGGRPRRVATGLTAPSALAWIGNRLYVADTKTPGIGRITVFQDFTGN